MYERPCLDELVFGILPLRPLVVQCRDECGTSQLTHGKHCLTMAFVHLCSGCAREVRSLAGTYAFRPFPLHEGSRAVHFPAVHRWPEKLLGATPFSPGV